VTIPEKPYFTYREFRSRVLGSSKSEIRSPIGCKPVAGLERNRPKCLECWELAKPLTLAWIELGADHGGLVYAFCTTIPSALYIELPLKIAQVGR
jgi:hypothetical protein